jgi:SPP1 family predicted phage head-tail adaptor
MDANRPHLITFQRFMETGRDDFNAPVMEWADYARAYASISFGTGAERREAAQEAGSAPATFRVLYSPKLAALSAKDRVNFKGSDWDITSVIPIGFQEGFEITAMRAG